MALFSGACCFVWVAVALVVLVGMWKAFEKAGKPGWACIAWALALLLGAWVWPLALGLLLLSAAGWRLVGRVARDGLYTLTRTTDA